MGGKLIRGYLFMSLRWCNMARRFTDKNKWEDEWYLSLDNDCRMVWEYLLDRCDHAGVFKKNMRMINFCCCVMWDAEKLESVFDGRIVDRETFYFIPKYLKFQYPKGLNSQKPAITRYSRSIPALKRPLPARPPSTSAWAMQTPR